MRNAKGLNKGTLQSQFDHLSGWNLSTSRRGRDEEAASVEDSLRSDCQRPRPSVQSVERARMGFVTLNHLRILALTIIASVAAKTSAQSTSTSLIRSGLDRYPLAICNDGSAAVYYHEQVIRGEN